MRLRALAAGFVLAMLLLASLGGAMCEASCVPSGEAHACCPAQATGGAAIVSSAPCAHPAHEQASLLTAPIFVTPEAGLVASLDTASFAVQSASRAVPATISPPVFPLRI